MLPLNYQKIIENKPYTKLLKEVPSELKNQLHNLSLIKRFQFKEYPKDLIADNTLDHTLRCVYLAKKINLRLNKAKLIRTLWVHDIPKLLTNDLTVIEKYRNLDADKNFRLREHKAAKKLLSSVDRSLLDLFNKADDFLKWKVMRVREIPLESIAAKIIDNSEGNMTFHYFVSGWVASEAYNPKLLPPTDSLIHTFRINNIMQNQLKLLPETHGKELANLIDTVLKTIGTFWKNVPQEKIPSVLGDYLKHSNITRN
uniref:HD domain-containing protein n=1 Tax=candidate division WWE3 bacterium TaxID=2053526 RepID=A0A7C4XT05_UNCKA